MTSVAASCQAIWDWVTVPEGINHELMPVMRMTVPKRLRAVTVSQIAPGTKIGRSYFLLLGFLPFDYDDIMIAELEPGRRFVETSTMMSMRNWRHERTITPRGDWCEVTDEVAFTLRFPAAAIPGTNLLVTRTLQGLFRHRHRRLAAHFGGRSARPRHRG